VLKVNVQIPQETGASCDFDRSQSEVAAFCETDGLIVLVLSAFMSLLVVWAIREGRLCARAIDQFLMGTTNLPR